MHDPNKIRHLLRRHLLEIGEQAGDGSWQNQEEKEYTPDGKAILVIQAIPISRNGSRPAAEVFDDPPQPSRRGRPAEVGRSILIYLRQHPDSPHAEIVTAMDRLGFGPTAVNDNLKVLKQMGLITHAGKGYPYSVVELP